MALSSYATDNNDSFTKKRKEQFLNSVSLSSRMSSIRRSSYVSNSSGRSDCVTSSITDTVTVEPRSKFTLYKINVHSDDKRWVVYRRYSDFVLLNKKLQKEFPNLAFKLPPKRWFRDNFDKTFVHKRQKGLQDFLCNLFSIQQLYQSPPVQQFFRLDNPPSPDEDLEASQIYCQSLEASCNELKQFVNQQELQIMKLKTELEDIEKYHNHTNKEKNTTTTTLLLAKNNLEHQLDDLKNVISQKNDEITKLKEEYRQAEAYRNAVRLQERQTRDHQIREHYSIFTEKQRQIESVFQNIVLSLSNLSMVKIDVGGKSIDVKPVECVAEKEEELKKLLYDSRNDLERLYKEHIEFYRKELEETKILIEKNEKILQNNITELETLKTHLQSTHEKYSRDILSRDQCIQQCQNQIFTQNHYISSLEQKYFYSLILGIKLNMALYGRDDEILNLKFEPSKLFLLIRENGIDVENWPSWVARKLASYIHKTTENGS